MFSTQSVTPSTGGFSFGSANSTAGAPATSSTFSFGGAANSGVTQPTASSFSFGSTNAPSGTQTSGFGFSQTPANTTTGTSGFGFGGATNPTSTPSAFGSQSTTTPLGFGSNTTTTTNSGLSFSGTGGLGTSSTGGFGTNNNLSFSNLGSSTTAPSSSFGFGSLGGNTNSFGSMTQQSGQPSTGFGARPVQSGGYPNTPAGPIFEAIDRLERSYAPVKDLYGRYQAKGDGYKNDECQFKTIKLVPKPLPQPYQQMGQQQMVPSAGFGGCNMSMIGSHQHQQQRPVPIDHLVYGALLEEIERDNVDPAQYIPVEEIGIESLRVRYENQDKARDSILKSTDQLSNMLGELNTSNQSISEKYRLLKMKQLKLNESLLKILRKIEVLRCHGNPLQATEISFRNQLHRLALDVEPPFKKLQDISINLALQNQPKDLYEDKIDEEDLMNLIGALKKQSEGLEYLAEVLRKDTRDIGIMKSELNKMT